MTDSLHWRFIGKCGHPCEGPHSQIPCLRPEKPRKRCPCIPSCPLPLLVAAATRVRFPATNTLVLLQPVSHRHSDPRGGISRYLIVRYTLGPPM